MRKIISICAVFAVMGLALSVQAAEPKFGYVDLQKCLNSVSEGKVAKSELEKTYNKRQKELESIQNELEAEKKQLEKERLVLTADALRAKEDAFRQKFLDLTQKMNTFKVELAQKEADLTGSILNAVRSVVEQIGQEEGYTMILEVSQDVVLYSPKNSDVTSQVIKAYNDLPKSKRRLLTR